MTSRIDGRARRLLITGIVAAGVGAGATGVALASSAGGAAATGTTGAQTTSARSSPGSPATASTSSPTPAPTSSHHCPHSGSSPSGRSPAG